MKKLTALLLAVLMLALPLCSLAEGFNSAEFIDWFNESNLWMTVANGHWSTDPADRITDEELEKIFSMATKQQNAVHWTPWYFVVIKDTEEQQKRIDFFKKELSELQAKLDKIYKFMSTRKWDELSDTRKMMLQGQRLAMDSYAFWLGKRLDWEKNLGE